MTTLADCMKINDNHLFAYLPVYPHVSFAVNFLNMKCLTPVNRLLSTALELLANPRADTLIKTNYINTCTLR